MAFVVLAKWLAKEGEDVRVADAISKLVEPSRAEPGCISYQPLRALDDARVFVIYEQYVDRKAYAAHSESQHFQRVAVAEGIPLLEARDRTFYETF